jgi:acyl-coenzyme A thioesterase PaaI-like protein
MTELKELVETKFAFLRNMGLKALDLAPNRVKLMLPKKGNENHLGTVWAGALFTLAEVPGGILVFTSFDGSKFYPVVKEMNIKFVKPATTDVTIEISMDEAEAARVEKEAEEKGKADFILDGELMDANDNVVAVTRGFYQLRKY